MLRVFRARASCLITALLLAVGTTTAAFDGLLHAGTSHDVACVTAGDVAHDASSHRFKTPTGDAGSDDHCIGCHLARAPRIGSQPASHAPHVADAPPPRPLAAIGSARAAALDSLPPRAPPSRLS